MLILIFLNVNLSRPLLNDYSSLSNVTSHQSPEISCFYSLRRERIYLIMRCKNELDEIFKRFQPRENRDVSSKGFSRQESCKDVLEHFNDINVNSGYQASCDYNYLGTYWDAVSKAACETIKSKFIILEFNI